MKKISLVNASTALFFLVAIVSCKKGGSDSGSNNGASIYDVTQIRITSSSIFRFDVYLDQVASTDVTIAYTTEAGTALANKDFKPVSGTVTIPSGKRQGFIEVEVTGDSTRKAMQTFYVQLSNPKNCTLTKAKGIGNINNSNGLFFPVDNTGYSTPTTYPGYTLAWNEEFNGTAIDATNWTLETGNGGWGNNELQNYTGRSENAFLSAGNLIIEARSESYGGSNYTSARMITKGKKVFKFGRIDIRAKMPKGQGIWPALWMLGNNIDAVSWPTCGEIDILELLGHEPNKIYGTLHWSTGGSNHASKGSSFISTTGSYDQQFHVYSLIWKQDVVKVLVDDVEFTQVTKADLGAATYPFNADFFFIFNIAVGGNWPGVPNTTTEFPQRMVVDYLRVFQ